jgi:hypothetical protein
LIHRPNIVRVDLFVGGIIVVQLFNTSFKGTIYTSRNNGNVNIYGFKFKENLPIYLKQRFPSDFSGLSIFKYNFISHISYSTMEKLIESGIPQYFHNFVFEHILDLGTSDGNLKAKAFTLNDLSFGFTIWLYACAISGGVFVAEILVFYTKLIVKKIVRELSGLFCFLVLLSEMMVYIK